MNHDTLDLTRTTLPLGAVAPDPQRAPALLQQLVDRHGAHWVGAATLPAWQTLPGDAVLLLPGDAVRFPEGLDVAVVLPELRSALAQAFRMGVAVPDDDDALGRRFGAQRRPSLVFLRDGRYVSTVAGMHDWTDFLAQVREALAAPVSHAPIGIAVAESARMNGSAGCH